MKRVVGVGDNSHDCKLWRREVQPQRPTPPRGSGARTWTANHTYGVARRTANGSQHSTLDCRAGALQNNMPKVGEKAESRECRLPELVVTSARMSQETVRDFTDINRRLWQVLIACTKQEATYHVCDPERSRFKAWKRIVSHCDLRTIADRSAASSWVTHQVSQRGLTSTRPKMFLSAK